MLMALAWHFRQLARCLSPYNPLAHCGFAPVVSFLHILARGVTGLFPLRVVEKETLCTAGGRILPLGVLSPFLVLHCPTSLKPAKGSCGPFGKSRYGLSDGSSSGPGIQVFVGCPALDLCAPPRKLESVTCIQITWEFGSPPF